MTNINPRIGAIVKCNWPHPDTGERMAWEGMVFGVNPDKQTIHVKWLGPCGVMDDRQEIPVAKFHEPVYDDAPEWTFENPGGGE